MSGRKATWEMQLGNRCWYNREHIALGVVLSRQPDRDILLTLNRDDAERLASLLGRFLSYEGEPRWIPTFNETDEDKSEEN